MKVSDLLNVHVTDVSLGGQAVARHRGRVVFVDRGLPGDELEVRVIRLRRAVVEAHLEAVTQPSPERVAPPCPHVERCGGCRFQDLAYPAQLVLKQRQVRETLVRIGGIAEPRVRPVRPASDTFRYRNKMEFSFHPGEDGVAVLGLHERGAFDRVFALETCLLSSERTLEILRLTQRFAATHRWCAYHPVRHQGMVRFLMVRDLPHTDQCAVHLVSTSAEVPELEEWARAVASLSPTVYTVSLLLNPSRSNVARGEEERLLSGTGVVVERLLGLEFEVTANTFLQTHSRQAEALYAAALEAARLEGGETVLDLYCGAGTLTLLFARATRAAVGVESATDAVDHARRNARRNRLQNVRFVEGEARRILREWARGTLPDSPAPEIVVVDPPRSGLHPRVVARVAELAPHRVIYVSCNPATLARDVRDFAARGFDLAEVEPFDMFPHTPHVECVARLEQGARR